MGHFSIHIPKWFSCDIGEGEGTEALMERLTMNEVSSPKIRLLIMSGRPFNYSRFWERGDDKRRCVWVDGRVGG